MIVNPDPILLMILGTLLLRCLAEKKSDETKYPQNAPHWSFRTHSTYGTQGNNRLHLILPLVLSTTVEVGGPPV